MNRAAAIALAWSLVAAPALPAPGVAAGEHAPLSLEQAVELVQRRTGARVLKAETLREGDETVYRLRLLAPDGRVSSVVVHAATGQVD